MPETLAPAREVVRRRIAVHGQVQGVGFRPLVYRLATQLSLVGWVRNDTGGVTIEVQGTRPDVEELAERLHTDLPPLARIDGLDVATQPHLTDETSFVIAASAPTGAVTTGVAPDAALCGACLSELLDPLDRRYRYPFINCTHCGPRYTLTDALPYDRVNTSMARFTMCEACRREYDDPTSRRFHAQPNACFTCGPRLSLVRADGSTIDTDDPLTTTVERLRHGEIISVKGLGGFHLACDARNEQAVDQLRRRKNREEKPFAVMVASPASLTPFAEVDVETRRNLTCSEAPIVMLRKRSGCDLALPGVAPGLAWLAAMLPYTPLHVLLFHEAVGRPAGTTWLDTPQPMVLVMTSANPGGEPLVKGNDEALKRLQGIADAHLLHDRDVSQRCDDSVCRSSVKGPIFIRRSRGYTPRAITLPQAGPSVLACGGWYKNTICLTRGDQAYLSQHIGDLDNPATCEALEQAADHLLDVLSITPQWVACDLHPDFFSTQFAQQFAGQRGLSCVGVQHHHAHAAAVAAEHHLDTPYLALTLDGVGLGTDGTAWGGELLRVAEKTFERLGHLEPLPLPGGDRAAREPWRMAAAALWMLGRPQDITQGRLGDPRAASIRQLLERGVNAPMTSSAGRLFDAAAGLLGVCVASAYEAQAAMLLEGLAEQWGPAPPQDHGFTQQPDGRLSFLPLLQTLADEQDAGRGASVFHATIAAGLAEWVLGAAKKDTVQQVVLAGGCFLNHVVTTRLRGTLEQAGLRVYEGQQAPCNDGGISLGQAWVAIQRAGADANHSVATAEAKE